ncbi:FlgK family flagellar hook-associated protein [Paracoccus sp. (in: a-proteobacteria)]|uniref:FlgK family flagellar hook-associated protein n=1 Tax=Paracoccus sp. TaxID=267 RepID=UPI00272C4433|nr:flagellar basal body protein [Paracoccus sp. (in: a-proteobacteria)]
MSNLLDIGRSGILAYRTALATVGENIANVNTEGFRRRDVATVTQHGAQSTPTTMPSGPQGVSLAEVRRAFDALVADRARNTQGGEAAAQAHLAGATAIETLMIPGDEGVDGTMRAFFDGLARLAANPTDMTTRGLVLQQAAALTDAVSGLGRGFQTLRRDMLVDAAAQAEAAQGLLEELAVISRRMSEAGEGAHALADRRDATLTELARILPISVTLGVAGRPTIRLGSEAGPLLLEGVRPAALSVTGEDMLTLHVRASDGQVTQSRLLASGSLAGMSRALGALDMAAAELDAFAREMTNSINRIHRGGVDLRGTPGGDMLANDGWRADPAAGNSGRVQVALTTMAASGTRAPIDLVFDGAQGLWRALDAQGAELGSGREELLLDGVLVRIAGAARDGDRIALRPVTGHAADLRLVLTDPAALAAASAFAAAAQPGNTGSAQLTALLQPPPAAPIPTLSGQTQPMDLLGGVVGLIPAGTQAVTVASLGRAPALTLSPAAGAQALVMPDGSFNLAGLGDAAAMAAALNGGLTDDQGRSLASLGLVAEAQGDTLRLTRPAGAPLPDAQFLGPSGLIAGLAEPGQPVSGTMQILTRNGRHVAGTPLSAAEAAALLTPENGFLPGAVYDPSPLVLDGAGYRGATVALTGAEALHRAQVPAPSPVIGAPGALPVAPPARLNLADLSGRSARIALPEGASAAVIAGRLNAALPGMTAEASTALEVSGLGAGPVSFDLVGLNGNPVRIEALLTGNDPAPLAEALNRAAPATGIRAEMAPDGSRLLLVQDQGHDITLIHRQGALQLAPATPEGQRLGLPADLPAGQAWRQGGTVMLTHAAGFQIEGGAVSAPVAPAPVRFSAAGAVARLDLPAIPGLAEGGQALSVTLNGITAEAAFAPATPARQIALTMATLLRAEAPVAEAISAPLSALPPEGAFLPLQVDGATYRLRFQNGEPVIDGPEPGRVTAALDASMRLVIRAEGVTDGAGLLTAQAAAFGFGPGQGRMVLTGQPTDNGALPADLPVRVAGADYTLRLLPGGGLDVPPGFPGLASRNPATGALRLDLAAPATGLVVGHIPQAGFGGPDAAIRVDGDTLVMASRGAPLEVSHGSTGPLGRQIALSGLPPEDLIVVASGGAAPRMGITMQSGPAPTHPGRLEVEVADAATGRLILRDTLSGHVVAEGRADAAGRAELGGMVLQFTGTARDGDRFQIVAAGPGSGNGAMAMALASLRVGDPASGTPGLGDRLTRIQADTGLRAQAAARSLETARAASEAAQRADAALGAVDLDAEAARLVQLQQAYQASAQAMTIARDLFETLLRMF